jgi:hypothetical protein
MSLPIAESMAELPKYDSTCFRRFYRQDLKGIRAMFVPIKSRYLELVLEGEAVILRFSPNADLTVGSSRRANRSIQLVKMQFKRLADKVEIKGKCVTGRFSNMDVSTLSHLASRIDAKLDRIRDEKVTIKMVEEILRLTPLERQRWTKDGRLPAAGNAYIQRGQTIRLWTYSPDVIARLLKHPDIIEGWRKADMTASAAVRGSGSGCST